MNTHARLEHDQGALRRVLNHYASPRPSARPAATLHCSMCCRPIRRVSPTRCKGC